MGCLCKILIFIHSLLSNIVDVFAICKGKAVCYVYYLFPAVGVAAKTRLLRFVSIERSEA